MTGRPKTALSEAFATALTLYEGERVKREQAEARVRELEAAMEWFGMDVEKSVAAWKRENVMTDPLDLDGKNMSLRLARDDYAERWLAAENRAEAAEARVRDLETENEGWQIEARKYVAEFKRLYERIAELETDDERAREARADYDAWQGRMQKRLARLMGPETRVAARDEETDDA